MTMDKDLTVEELYRVTKDAFGEYYNHLDNPAGTGIPEILGRVKKQGQVVLKILSRRTVTREWLEEKAIELIKRFDGECGLTSLQTVGIMTVLCEKGDFEDLLQELGIEVIE